MPNFIALGGLVFELLKIVTRTKIWLVNENNILPSEYNKISNYDKFSRNAFFSVL